MVNNNSLHILMLINRAPKFIGRLYTRNHMNLRQRPSFAAYFYTIYKCYFFFLSQDIIWGVWRGVPRFPGSGCNSCFAISTRKHPSCGCFWIMWMQLLTEPSIIICTHLICGSRTNTIICAIWNSRGFRKWDSSISWFSFPCEFCFHYLINSTTQKHFL